MSFRRASRDRAFREWMCVMPAVMYYELGITHIIVELVISALNHGNIITNYYSYYYIDVLVRDCVGVSVIVWTTTVKCQVCGRHNYSNRRYDTHAHAAARCRPVDPGAIIPDYDTWLQTLAPDNILL